MHFGKKKLTAIEQVDVYPFGPDRSGVESGLPGPPRFNERQVVPRSSFSVGFHATRAVEVLDLTGELDAHTVPELEAAFQKCWQHGNHQIVVNGAHLRFISSAGLGVFMGHIDEIREQGGDIKFAALKPNVFNVFDLLGFPLLFNIVATEEEAIALFES